MRYVFIDLSSDNYFHQPQIFGGYAGEHNETLLQVRLPKRMVGIECSRYLFDFQTSEDNKISYPISVSELKDDILSFSLVEQLTIAGKLSFNVSAILSDGQAVSLISKTNKAILLIESSSEGNITLPDPNGYKDELEKIVDERILKINPANVDKIYNPKSENAQSGKAVSGVFAPAIKQNMTGKAIKINDASPTEHELKITANYFKLDKVTEQDNEKGRIVINSDKSLEITCKSSEYIILGKLTTLCPNIKGGDVFTLSYSVDGTNNSLGLQIGNADYYIEEKRICSADTYNNYNVNAVLPQDISNVYMFYFSDMTTKTLSNIALFKGIVDDITDVTVSRYGKNLITYPYYNTSKTDRGITFTVNEDKTITANGTAESTLYFIIRQKDLALSKGTYYFSG